METLSLKQLSILQYLANNSDVIVCVRPKGEPTQPEILRLIELKLIKEDTQPVAAQLRSTLESYDYIVIEATEQGRIMFYDCEFCPSGKTIQ